VFAIQGRAAPVSTVSHTLGKPLKRFPFLTGAPCTSLKRGINEIQQPATEKLVKSAGFTPATAGGCL
jgi:hypothetical protein